MDENTRRKSNLIKVAVVGSGMAGLVTAWMLNGDKQARYQVELFESGVEPSLDSASLSVTNSCTHEIERIDVPMRAFTEGYYNNLKALYDFLGVRYCVQPFIFTFSRLAAQTLSRSHPDGDFKYFVHASNSHRLPPLKPESMNWASYIVELFFALMGYLWFTLCCFTVDPRHNLERQPCESFGEYLRRIRLPQRFVRLYLLPLLSAVTTCSHNLLLEFPAKDIIDYKRKITFGRQLTVTNGINQVQKRLLEGIQIRCSTHVENVTPVTSGLKVSWRTPSNDEEFEIGEKLFDIVILAVPPNVAGIIFKPLREEMKHIPTVRVETITHTDESGFTSISNCEKDSNDSSPLSSQPTGGAHIIHLRTSYNIDGTTEATHVLPSGTMVTTCPLSPITSSRVLESHTFTRVLRTPESRRRLERIFNTSTNCEPSGKWKNGDGGVWLVGGWCWDGMVLLEGCMVSAIRVGKALDVRTPFLAMNPQSQP